MRTPDTRSLVIDEEMNGLDYRDEDEVEINFKTADWDKEKELKDLQWVVSKKEIERIDKQNSFVKERRE